MTPYYADDFVTIYHGDCREVLPTLGECDLVLTDPPYGVNYVGRGVHGMLQGDDDNAWVGPAVRLALQRLRINRHFYIFGPEMGANILGFGATCQLVWDKCAHGLGHASVPWSPAHEFITFGVWNPYKSQQGSGSGLTRLRRGSVLRYARQSNGRGAQRHPTEKPVALLRELIECSSKHSETVLDPFAGVGSSLVAARAEGRKAIGIEVEERYCEIAAKRLAQEVLAFGAAS